MNVIPAPHVGPSVTMTAATHECFAASWRCLIVIINKIWTSIIELLQQVYSYLVCSRASDAAPPNIAPIDVGGRSDRYTQQVMESFRAAVGRERTCVEFGSLSHYLYGSPRLVQVRGELGKHTSEISELLGWTTNYIHSNGGFSANTDQIFTMVNRLAEDLALNNVLADYCDLVQSDDTALIDQGLRDFLRTGDTTAVIESLRRIALTRYPGGSARYPIILPEVDANFSRWDLLAVKRFHRWLNTIMDNDATFDVEIQRALNSPYQYGYLRNEIKYFASLIENMRMNDVLAPFLHAICVDPSTVRCIQFAWGPGCSPRSIFEKLGVQLPIAFPTPLGNFTQEDVLLTKRFCRWLCENYPTPTTEFDIDRYLERLDQEIEPERASQSPGQQDQSTQRNTECRKFASLMQYIRRCRGEQRIDQTDPTRQRVIVPTGPNVFFSHFPSVQRTVALLPEAIRRGDRVPLCNSMSISPEGWHTPMCCVVDH